MAKRGRKTGGVGYSKQTTRAINNWRLDVKITGAEDITKEFRKEINRVFHAVNRRLENLQNSGAFSPAAEALKAYLDGGSGEIGSYNKFAKLTTSLKGLEQLKRDYAACIEFLKKPTSTSSGARTFEKSIISELESQKGRKLYPGEFEHLKEMVTKGEPSIGNLSALMDSDPSKVMNYFKEETEDVGSQIENAAKSADNTLENLLEQDIANFVGSDIIEKFGTFKVD